MIGAAIESALAERVEVVVVDDGSTDGSWGVISSYPVVAIHTPNRGVSAARNEGVRASSGRFIRFLDSDDRILGTADLLEAAKALPPRHIAVGSATSPDYGFDGIGPLSSERVFGATVPSVLAIFPRKALGEGFDETLTISEDYELAARLHARGYAFHLTGIPAYEIGGHSGPRLTRELGKAGHRGQLKAARAAARHLSTDAERRAAARLIWTFGRDASRDRRPAEADALFDLALKLGGTKARVGKPPLGLLYRFLAPYTAELAIEGLKRLRPSSLRS
jgi:glycosyltransferase involved in cell wall biosynthesis